eukprot:4006009-Prorocentrum_lima.AAC.1
MTSSLVGSEMCIRDRTWKAKSRMLICGHVASESQALCEPTSTHHVEIGPVSYTHLTLPTICSV